MPKTSKEMSVSALERLLDRRKAQLTSLTRKRKTLQKNLAKIERRIMGLEGRNGIGSRTRRRSRKRPKNARPLVDVVTEILTRNKDGYLLAKLTEKVLATGYKSTSRDFKNVLYQCLYNHPKIMHDAKTGCYKLKG